MEKKKFIESKFPSIIKNAKAGEMSALDLLTRIVKGSTCEASENNENPFFLGMVINNIRQITDIFIEKSETRSIIITLLLEICKYLIPKGKTWILNELEHAMEFQDDQFYVPKYYFENITKKYVVGQKTEKDTFILNPEISKVNNRQFFILLLNRYQLFDVFKSYLSTNPPYSNTDDICSFLEGNFKFIHPDFVSNFIRDVMDSMTVPNIRILRMLMLSIPKELEEYGNAVDGYLEELEKCGNLIVPELANLVQSKTDKKEQIVIITSIACEQFIEYADKESDEKYLMKFVNFLVENDSIDYSIVIDSLHAKWNTFGLLLEDISKNCTQEKVESFFSQGEPSIEKTRFISQLLNKSEKEFELKEDDIIQLCTNWNQETKSVVFDLMKTGKYQKLFIRCITTLYEEAEERMFGFTEIYFILESVKIFGHENFDVEELANAVMYTIDSTLIVNVLKKYEFLRVADPTVLFSVCSYSAKLFRYVEDNLMDKFSEFEDDIEMEEATKEYYAVTYLKAYKMYKNRDYLIKASNALKDNKSDDLIKSLVNKGLIEQEFINEGLFVLIESPKEDDSIPAIEKLMKLKESKVIDKNFINIVKAVEDTEENAKALLDMYLDPSFTYSFHTDEFREVLMEKIYKYPGVLADAIEEIEEPTGTNIRTSVISVKDPSASALLQAFSASPDIIKALLTSSDEFSQKLGKLLSIIAFSKKEYVDPTPYFPQYFFDKCKYFFDLCFRKLSSSFRALFKFNYDYSTYQKTGKQYKNIVGYARKFLFGGTVQEIINKIPISETLNTHMEKTTYLENTPKIFFIKVTNKDVNIQEDFDITDLTEKETKYHLLAFVENRIAYIKVDENKYLKCTSTNCEFVTSIPTKTMQASLLYVKEGACSSFDEIWESIPEETRKEVINKDQYLGSFINNVADWSKFTQDEGYYNLAINIATKCGIFEPIKELCENVSFSTFFFENMYQITCPIFFLQYKDIIIKLAHIYPKKEELFDSCIEFFDQEPVVAKTSLLVASELDGDSDKCLDVILNVMENDNLNTTDEFTKILNKLIDCDCEAVSIAIDIPQVRQKQIIEGNKRIIPFITLSEDIVMELNKLATADFAYEVLKNTDDVSLIKMALPKLVQSDSVVELFEKLNTEEFISDPKWFSVIFRSTSENVLKESVSLVEKLWPPQKQDKNNELFASELVYSISNLLKNEESSFAMRLIKEYNHVFTESNNVSVQICKYCFTGKTMEKPNAKELYEYVPQFLPENYLISTSASVYEGIRSNFYNNSYGETIIMFMFLFLHTKEMAIRTTNTSSQVEMQNMLSRYSLSESFVEDWLVPKIKELMSRDNLSIIIQALKFVHTDVNHVYYYIIDYITSLPYFYSDDSFLIVCINGLFFLKGNDQGNTTEFILKLGEILDDYDPSVPFVTNKTQEDLFFLLNLCNSMFTLCLDMIKSETEDEKQAALILYLNALFKILPLKIPTFMKCIPEISLLIKGTDAANEFIYTAVKAFRLMMGDVSIVGSESSPKLKEIVGGLQSAMNFAFNRNDLTEETYKIIIGTLTGCFKSKVLIPYFEDFVGENSKFYDLFVNAPDSKYICTCILKLSLLSSHINKNVNGYKLLELAKSIQSGERTESANLCCRIILMFLRQCHTESVEANREQIKQILQEYGKDICDAGLKKLIDNLQ